MRVAKLLVSVCAVLAIMNGRAEASRIAFNGAGAQGAIVWDDNGDVSTMATNCGGAGSCTTSVYGDLPAGFGFQVTPEEGFSLDDLRIQSLHMLLSVSALPGDPCVGDVQCGLLGDFGSLSDSGWTDRTSGDPTDVDGSTQALMRLATVSVLSQPGFFALTQGSLDFLATLDPGILNAAHVGVDVTRLQQSFLTPFVVETGTLSTTPVPEPSTLLLLGSGAVAAAARLRKRRR